MNQKRKTSQVWLLGAAIVAPVISALVGLSFYWSAFDYKNLSKSHERWGQFGDFLGGIVNPTVGLITVILLVITLRSQQSELEEQRKQIARQAFEQTFFSWITTLRESINALYVSMPNNGELKGNGVFGHLTKTSTAEDVEIQLFRSCVPHLADDSEVRPSWMSELERLYQRIWREKKADCAFQAAMVPYRILFQLMKYVDEHPILGLKDRRSYMKIVRSTIGLEFLKFIFLARSQTESSAIHKLCERYRFLFFLPANSGSTLIATLLRLHAHNFPVRAFNPKTLRALRNSDTSSEELCRDGTPKNAT